MALPSSAVEHYQTQQVIVAAAAVDAAALWSTVGEDFDQGYAAIESDLFATVAAAQVQAARSGVRDFPEILDEQGIDATQFDRVNPNRFAGGTPDSRPLEGLLRGTVVQAKLSMLAGSSTADALTRSGQWLQGRTMDVVRDADRQAMQGSLATTKVVTTWTRMLNPPSCKFCVMLAGKVYRWNQGFKAHPWCDCRHVPTQEVHAGDLTTDPYSYFRSLSPERQDKVFGLNDAQALRDGADIYRVVNTRFRGLADDALKNNGSRRGWQSRKWDTPSKMTVDAVYGAAGRDRELARKLLEDNGFITGPQTAGGNLKGNNPGGEFGDLAAGAMGRGGTRVGATKAYRDAVRTGVRDPRNPATQTAAERRVQRSILMRDAVAAGRNPFGTGPLSPAQRSLVEREYARQMKLADENPQLDELRKLLRRR